MRVIVSVLTGYLIGSVNPAYIIGRFRGVDIREKGSGNAGASNALIAFGKVMGVLCAIIDIAKPCFAIWIVKKLFPHFTYAYVFTGVALYYWTYVSILHEVSGWKGPGVSGRIYIVF